MMQVLPKWEIIIEEEEGAIPLKLFIHNNYLSNVLRQIADIGFEFEPQKIVIVRR